MSIERGRVVSVDTVDVRDFLTGSQSISDTVLGVDNTDVFETETGSGQVQINGSVYSYESVDSDASTITLGSGLLAAGEVDDAVIVYPLVPEKFAQVVLEDSDGDALTVRVPNTQSVFSSLADGIRVGVGEVVLIDLDGDEPFIVEVVNDGSLIDGGSIDPDSTVPPAALTDGLPPGVSPDVTVEPFAVGAVKVSWATGAYTDPTKQRIYASFTSPVTTSDEVVGETSGVGLIFSELAGEKLPMDGTLVYAAALAFDADGDAAALGGEGSASPRQADNDYISADYGYFGEIQANQITAGEFEADLAMVGKLTVGNYVEVDGESSSIIIYADPERTIPLVSLRPEGSIFRGQVIADDVSVLNGLILMGAQSTIAIDAVVTMENTIPDPAVAPSVSVITKTSPWYPQATFTDRSMFWDGSQWLKTYYISSGYVGRGRDVDPSDGSSSGFIEFERHVTSSRQILGGVLDGSTWRVLRYSTVSGWTFQDYDTGGSFVYQGASVGYASNDPAIGWDNTGSQLITAGLLSGGSTPIVKTFTDSDWTGQVDYTFTGGTAPYEASGARLTFVGKGTFDYGAERIVVATPTTVYAFSISGTVLTLAHEWSLGGTYDAVGWDGTNWFASNTSDTLKKYSGWIGDSGGTDRKWWASYTNAVTTPTETAQSPKSSIDLPDRRYLRISASPRSAQTTHDGFYTGYGATEPARTAMWRQGSLTTAETLDVSSKVTSGSNPPASSGFTTAGSPGKLKSQTGGFEVHGDGTGKWPLLYRAHVSRQRDAAQSISNNTATTVTFVTAVDTDPGSIITYSAGTFTVTQAGLYTVHAIIRWASSTSGDRTVQLQRNPGSLSVAETILSTPGSGQQSQQVNATFRCDASDTIKIVATQTSGGSLNITQNGQIDITYAGA